jgi:hypothetical protein
MEASVSAVEASTACAGSAEARVSTAEAFASDGVSTVIRIEASSSVAAVNEAAAIEVVRGVEAVAEGIPEEASPREPGIAITRPIPSGIEARIACVFLG